MDVGRAGQAAIVEDLDRYPLGTRRHADRTAAGRATDHHTHRPRAVPAHVVGVGGCCPFGSYQLLVPPRHFPARSACVASTPVSMFATTMPWPRKPRSHIAGALT